MSWKSFSLDRRHAFKGSSSSTRSKYSSEKSGEVFFREGLKTPLSLQREHQLPKMQEKGPIKGNTICQ